MVAVFGVEHDAAVVRDRQREMIGLEQVVRPVADGAADLAFSGALAGVDDRGVRVVSEEFAGRNAHGAAIPTSRANAT